VGRSRTPGVVLFLRLDKKNIKKTDMNRNKKEKKSKNGMEAKVQG